MQGKCCHPAVRRVQRTKTCFEISDENMAFCRSILHVVILSKQKQQNSFCEEYLFTDDYFLQESPTKAQQASGWGHSLLPELAADPWDQYSKPPQIQPPQRPRELPSIKPATYQPYNPKPTFNPPPIKKLPVQAPAPQAARPYLPPATPAAKPPPASLRPTAAAFNPAAAPYRPPMPAYNPPAAAYNPTEHTYNPTEHTYNAPTAAYNPPQGYGQHGIGAGQVHYTEPPNSSQWEPPQQPVQQPGGYNRTDSDLQMMMNQQVSRPAKPSSWHIQ